MAKASPGTDSEQIEGERRRAQDQENIRQFLETYKKTVDKYNIKPSDIYNMDETGLRIGVGRGQWVIVPSNAQTQDRQLARYRHMIASVFDTEHVTIVETISGDGCTIDPLIIIKGSIIQARWFADIKNTPNLAITVTESGYSL